MELSKSKGINRKAKSRPRSPLLEEGSLFPLPEGGSLCPKEVPSARRRFPLIALSFNKLHSVPITTNFVSSNRAQAGCARYTIM